MSAEKGGRKRKAPKNTEWRGDTLHGRIRIKGKLHRWSLRTDEVELARKIVAEDIERLKAAAFHSGTRVKYIDLVSAWGEQHILHQVGARTAKRYLVSLEQLESFLLDLFVDEIDDAKIKEIIDARRAGGVSTATIRRDLTALASVLDYGEATPNPARIRATKLKERRDPIILPEIAHVERVINRAPAMIGAITAAALHTGCRQEELVTAERARLDHVHKQLTVIGKGNKLRVIQLNAPAYAVLSGVPPHLRSKLLFWQETVDDAGKVGVGPLRDLAGRFAKLVKATAKAARKEGADFRPMTFHHLRHRYAVDYLKRREGTIYDLQQQLGHSSVATTEIYLRYLSPEEVRAAKFGAPQESQNESQRQRFGEGE
jgi:integrase/recombinase XerD